MVSEPMTVGQAVKLAIREEIKAHELYMKLSKKVARPETRVMLLELAEQELKHRRTLEEVLLDDSYTEIGSTVNDQVIWKLNPEDAPKKLKKNATPRDTLLFAIREEFRASELYSDLAKYLAGTELENIFTRLSNEEQNHRTLLEQELEKSYQMS